MIESSGQLDNRIPPQGTVLTHRDGRAVAFVEHGRDSAGEYLILEHRNPHPGAMNGPHWHPQLEETFFVLGGRIRLRVDGKDSVLQAGDQMTVKPRQVHQFWNESKDELVMRHTIRPPGQH